jgi:hypothetical protein
VSSFIGESISQERSERNVYSFLECGDLSPLSVERSEPPQEKAAINRRTPKESTSIVQGKQIKLRLHPRFLPMHDFPPYLPLIGAFLGLLTLWGAFRAGRRRRLVENLPTSKTTGVFIGLVELKGTAEAANPLTSFLAEQPCTAYSWSVDEHWSRTVTETYTDGDGKTQTRTRHESGWTTVASGGEMLPGPISFP